MKLSGVMIFVRESYKISSATFENFYTQYEYDLYSDVKLKKKVCVELSSMVSVTWRYCSCKESMRMKSML
jgi:hypothetical protein